MLPVEQRDPITAENGLSYYSTVVHRHLAANAVRLSDSGMPTAAVGADPAVLCRHCRMCPAPRGPGSCYRSAPDVHALARDSFHYGECNP